MYTNEPEKDYLVSPSENITRSELNRLNSQHSFEQHLEKDAHMHLDRMKVAEERRTKALRDKVERVCL